MNADRKKHQRSGGLVTPVVDRAFRRGAGITLGAELERDRLLRRARRLRAVITELRRQVESQPAELVGAKHPMLRAIAEFEADLEVLERRLNDLAGRVPSAHDWREPQNDWTAQ